LVVVGAPDKVAVPLSARASRLDPQLGGADQLIFIRAQVKLVGELQSIDTGGGGWTLLAQKGHFSPITLLFSCKTYLKAIKNKILEQHAVEHAIFLPVDASHGPISQGPTVFGCVRREPRSAERQ
jgi:hypothetical protein